MPGGSGGCGVFRRGRLFGAHARLAPAGWRVDLADVVCQAALGAVDQIEADLRALLQGTEAIHLDGGKVREDIFATFGGLDEAEALDVIEPLDESGSH